MDWNWEIIGKMVSPENPQVLNDEVPAEEKKITKKSELDWIDKLRAILYWEAKL